MNQESLIAQGKEHIMNTYRYFPVAIEKGQGCYVWDKNGKKYLDFVAGIAVNSLGYSNEKLIANLAEQMKKLFHCSNLYWNEPAIEAASVLTSQSDFDKVFFCNSGAEAIETSLKLARKYGKKAHGENCFEIITMEHSFHGRTYGAITATGQQKYQKGLNPLLPGIKYTPYNDFEVLKSIVNEKTCAVLIEPVQGEGGIRPAKKEFLEQVRNLCNEKDIVLIFDEVQSGIGRIGELFAYKYYNVVPDIIALAKGLGGGFPIGAAMAKDKFASAFEPGDHASTFGGNPLACTAANTVLNEIVECNLLDNVKEQGAYLKEQLLELQKKHNIIIDIRGIGLMQGIELSVEIAPIVQKAIDKGLLLIGAGTNVIRFVPPLIIKKEEIDEAMLILADVLQEFNR